MASRIYYYKITDGRSRKHFVEFENRTTRAEVDGDRQQWVCLQKKKMLFTKMQLRRIHRGWIWDTGGGQNGYFRIFLTL